MRCCCSRCSPADVLLVADDDLDALAALAALLAALDDGVGVEGRLVRAGGVYALVAGWAGWRVARIGAEKPPLLASTLAELGRDRTALRDGTLARRVAEACGDEGAA